MVEKQSEIGRDAQLAMLMRHKWQAEIERAVDKVKLGVIPVKKRTKTDKWFRRQWYRAMMRDRKRRCVDGRLSENRMRNRMSFNRREIGPESDEGKI
jgi:hypothetical protein